MTQFVFGDVKAEIRPWGDPEEGKALLLTRDQGLIDSVLKTMDENPGAYEPLYEPFDPEDADGMLAVIADRMRTGLFFDFEKWTVEACVCMPEPVIREAETL